MDGNVERKMAKRNQHTWTFEILGLLFSLAMAAAIGVLLPIKDNSLVSAWTLPFSLNTVVSILGVASRASLVFVVSACLGQEKWNWFANREDNAAAFGRFDDASRGPLGSLRLVWWIKLR
jgi:hypothetical protein